MAEEHPRSTRPETEGVPPSRPHHRISTRIVFFVFLALYVLLPWFLERRAASRADAKRPCTVSGPRPRALVAFHALTSRQIRALALTDIVDARLTIDGRVVDDTSAAVPSGRSAGAR